MKQRSIFRRILLLIICLLVPILGIYTYSNYRTQANLTEKIESLNMNHALFFISQVESRLERLNESAVFLSYDDDVQQFIFYDLIEETDRILLKQKLLEKLTLMNTYNDWNDWMAIISPRNDLRVFTNFSATDVDTYKYTPRATSSWKVQEMLTSPVKRQFLIRNFAFPFASQNQGGTPQLIIQVGLSLDSLSNMLNQFNNDRRSEAFLYFSGEPAITDGQLPDGTLATWEKIFASGSLGDKGSLKMEAGKIDYLVSYAYSKKMDWYLVTMTPQKELFAPIKQGWIIFYISITLLLLFAIWAGYLIFRYVEIPITQLINGVSRFEKGEYSVRLGIGRAHDFSYLFKSFNRMAGTIQELIEKVYLEQIRSREATLKQLQSQINPHFLYNSLYFVESMIYLDKREAASDMVMNLAQYFRYATYTDKNTASLEEELRVVESYLRIHKLRNNRFDYQIDIPSTMLDIEIPRLILQPIVENAIVYGIEGKEGKGVVKLTGNGNEDGWWLAVDDNGPGIDMDKRSEIEAEWKFSTPVSPESCGMYNVNQRLRLNYGEGSGLEILTSPEGGCRIVLKLGKRKGIGDCERIASR
jgi:two-component system, sensor histidine kinase YesM